jgi:hypothetical protein
MKSHELAKELLNLPNYQIIMSVDQEGNYYGTIDKEYSIGIRDEKEDMKEQNQPLIILFPYKERLDKDEIPKELKKKVKIKGE